MNSTSRASGELPDDGDDMYTLQQYPILSIISSGNLKILELFFRHTGRNAIPGKAPAFQEPRFPPEHGMSRGLLAGKKGSAGRISGNCHLSAIFSQAAAVTDRILAAPETALYLFFLVITATIRRCLYILLLRQVDGIIVNTGNNAPCDRKADNEQYEPGERRSCGFLHPETLLLSVIHHVRLEDNVTIGIEKNGPGIFLCGMPGPEGFPAIPAPAKSTSPGPPSQSRSLSTIQNTGQHMYPHEPDGR